ncbi:hypothetical protein LLG96_17880 [bacterium]|nr:hypothetical protein [bacterium]
MKIGKVLFALLLAISLIAGIPITSRAEVMMTAYVTGLGFDILPTALFTVDDWLSNPNLWSITIINTPEGNKTVNRLVIDFTLSNAIWGDIATGELRVIGEGDQYFKQSLAPGQTYTIVNTMLTEETNQVITSGWSQKFVDEAMRIGYMPEGTYTFSFAVSASKSWYDNSGDPIVAEPILESIEIRNPLPPELVSPEQNSQDAPSIPRFTWQAPQVTDLSRLRSVKRNIDIYYTIKLWEMFETNGSELTQENAITRKPIWTVEKWKSTSIDFDPGQSRRELIAGRPYCWQVQAFDGTGRFISASNEGKSDVWPFTIKFTPPTINEPLLFYPLRVSWTPAQAGGASVLYNLRIADNADFSNAYVALGLTTTSFTYPSDGPALRYGVIYYLRVRTTDEAGLPLGEPALTTFTLPSTEITLSSPADGSTPPTMTPAFQWQGSNDYYIVTVANEEANWSDRSGAVQGTSWTYDGEELRRGTTYTWYVTPANEHGDPVGANSDSWSFSTSPEDQISLISPINARVSTIFPVFTWNSYTPATGNNVQYRIIITDDSGNTIHSEDVSATTYTYSTSAPGLLYAARYNWSVAALVGGDEIGQRSQSVWFVTPFVEGGGGQEVTITSVSDAVKLVLRDYPGFEPFANKILTQILAETGPLTPAELMDIIDKYKIVNVTAK